MKPVFALIVLIVGLNAWGSESTLNLPVDLERQKLGYSSFPVIQCPDISKKYEDILEQLGSIKDKIKSEACPAAELESLREVDNLDVLLRDERVTFVELVEKVVKNNEELSNQEISVLRDYLDKVVRRVAKVTGLVNNPACFDQEDKVSTLTALSSFVGEVTGAVGALGGPLGKKIGLGGQLAAGLLQSVDTIVQARKTYDYRDFEDQKNYLVNLCTYYEFKKQLDPATDTVRHGAELKRLNESARQLLVRLDEDCENCSVIINDYADRYNQGETFPIEVTPGHFVNKQAQDLAWQEIEAFYSPLVQAANTRFGFKREKSGPGHYSIRTLRTFTWTQDEIMQLADEDKKDLDDTGRREVIRVQEEIENFLFSREGPRFISHHLNTFEKDFRTLVRLVNEASYFMSQARGIRRQPSLTTRLENIFSPVTETKDQFGTMTVFDLVSRQMGFQDEIMAEFHKLRVSFGVVQNNCNFFRFARLNYHRNVGQICRQFVSVSDRYKAAFSEINGTQFSVSNPWIVKVFFSDPVSYSRNWVESTALLLEDMAKNPDLFIPKPEEKSQEGPLLLDLTS